MKRNRWQVLAGICTAALMVSGCSGNGGTQGTAPAPTSPAAAPGDLTRPAPTAEGVAPSGDYKIPCIEDILRMEMRLAGEEWDEALWLEYGHDFDAMAAEQIGTDEQLNAMGITTPEELCAAYHDGRLEAFFQETNDN